MKSTSSFLRNVAVLLTMSLASMLGACGQAGPLYMPTKPALDTPAPATAAPATTSNAAAQNPSSPKSSAP